MYPFWIIGTTYISMRKLLTAVGCIISVIVVTILLTRRLTKGMKEEKQAPGKWFFHVLLPIVTEVCIFITAGHFLGNMIRALTRPLKENLAEEMRYVVDGAGVHFIGTVFASAVLLPLIFQWIYRREADSKLDVMAFFFTIQHICNRIGCFLEGCCYGIPASGLLSVRFPENPPYRVFPSQLFEASLMLLLLILQCVLYKKGKSIFKVTMLLFGASILLSECFMDKRGVVMYAGLTAIQVAAILLMIISLIYIFAARRKSTDGKTQKGR
ncbi:MAG: prolipoprotein diacylglyceryl transferase [Lachnospiraceae bacterium]|nr:prolipoprotein diacylglyceryl transferase [Lachnospiraceae bacterium]